VPTVGALHDPPAGPAADAADHWFFAAAPDMRSDATASSFRFAVVVIVALIEADVLGAAWAAWCSDRHGVERLADHPLVVDVGASQRDANRDAASIGQYMAFGAELATIGGIGTGEVPPFGAFTEALSSDDHFKSMPRSSS